MIRLAVISAVAAALLLAACAGSSDGEPLTGDPDIRGEVTSLSADGSGEVLGTALIEGEIEDDTTYDRASVRIEGDTKVYRQGFEELIEAVFADLRAGQTVEAWLTGPVAESYPVQAKAAQIVIIGGLD